ncbi:MAG: GGDEF domain-containing response regulator [Proteobacteria bacterium]|nr:GGDEF domain-containing response regulator [Pseudomonadota bacterium]
MRVLIVEDDGDYVDYLKLVVPECCPGPSVVDAVDNTDDAIAKLRGESYDLCLLDYMLEEDTGLTVLRNISSEGTKTAFIFLTSHAKREVASEAMELGAVDYLVKGRFEVFDLERSISFALHRKTMESEMQDAALHDPLTGLGNRALFEEQLKLIAAQAKRDGAMFGILYIDIDGFKPVNDTHGHQAGDDLLRQIGERITGRARESDVVARLGGDEFAVILAHVDRKESVARVARDLEESISAPYTVKGQPVTIGASIGASVYPDDGDEIDQLVALSDRRMYDNKKARKKNARRA